MSSASNTGQDVRARFFQVPGCDAGAAAGVEDGEIERLIVRAKLDEQIEHLVEHLVGAGVGAVDLVEDDDRPQLVLKRFFQHEAGLRHGPFGGIDEQEDAVGHAQDAFDFAAEIGVAGGVDQVDLGGLAVGAGVIDGHVLGEDGDAALAFQGIGIQQGILLDLAVAEIAALAQQGVDQRRFAVIDVGDDGDIANVVAHLIHSMTFIVERLCGVDRIVSRRQGHNALNIALTLGRFK